MKKLPEMMTSEKATKESRNFIFASDHHKRLSWTEWETFTALHQDLSTQCVSNDITHNNVAFINWVNGGVVDNILNVINLLSPTFSWRMWINKTEFHSSRSSEIDDNIKQICPIEIVGQMQKLFGMTFVFENLLE